MKHPLLHGEYDLTVDEKHRVLIPADVRRAIPSELGEAFYVVTGTNKVPWFYAERYYEELVSQVPTDMLPDDDLLAFDQLRFAMTSRLPWDKQGRVLIPDKVLKRSQIGTEVTLIGARDHLELWNRADWEVRREELERRSAEIVAKAKQAHRQAQASAQPPSYVVQLPAKP